MSTGFGGSPPPPGPPAPGFDPLVAQQISLQILTGAINSQQLNAAQARNMVAASSNALTLGVQLQQLSFLRKVTAVSPMSAAAASNITAAGLPSAVAALQTAFRAPGGQ